MLQRTITLYRNAYGGIDASIWLLALVMFINRSGTMVIPFMTVYATQYLHFTLREAGFVMACAGLGSVIGVYAGGWFTDRVGHYRVQLVSLASGGVLFFVVMQMRTLPSLCASIFLLSIVGEAFRPANSASIAHYATGENLTRAYSLNRLAINLGWSIGPALGGFFATIGYQYLFIADGVTSVLSAIMLFFFVKNRTQPATVIAQAKPTDYSSAFQDRLFLAFLFFVLLFACSFMPFFSLVPVYWKTQLHISEFNIGLLMAANGLLVALFEMLLIYQIEHKQPKLTFIRWGIICCGFSYLLMAISGHLLWITPLTVVIMTLSEMFAMPFMNSFVVERSSAQARGQYLALYSMCYSVSQVVAPATGAFVADAYGFEALWWSMVGIMGVAFVGFRWVQNAVIR
jgi:predicted MFS family arabinose efflux permease